MNAPRFFCNLCHLEIGMFSDPDRKSFTINGVALRATFSGPGNEVFKQSSDLEDAKATVKHVCGNCWSKLEALIKPAPADDLPACPTCGCEVRGQGGYLQCECPPPARTQMISPSRHLNHQ